MQLCYARGTFEEEYAADESEESGSVGFPRLPAGRNPETLGNQRPPDSEPGNQPPPDSILRNLA